MTSDTQSAQRDNWDTVWSNVAASIATRSLCSREQVGAVIISATNRIVSVGYNGPPAGFWHGNQSCIAWCPRARGDDFHWAVDSNADVVPTGSFWRRDDMTCYQHPLADEFGEPPIVLDTDEKYIELGFKKVTNFSADYSDCPALHAEANALSVCDRAQREGGTIYTTSHICFPCAKLVANAGLSTVVIRPAMIAEHRTPQKSYDFLELCGLTVIILEV